MIIISFCHVKKIFLFLNYFYFYNKYNVKFLFCLCIHNTYELKLKLNVSYSIIYLFTSFVFFFLSFTSVKILKTLLESFLNETHCVCLLLNALIVAFVASAAMRACRYNSTTILLLF